MPGPGMELIDHEEVDEALEVLKSGQLGRYGNPDNPKFKGKVLKFEKAVADLAGVPYAVAVNSGTSALLTAFAALGIGPGDEIIVPGYTFVASISSIVYSRAVPILAEIDKTFNLDPEDVESKITPRTKAILVVHMMGNPARLDELKAIADRHGIALVEDCAQAFGARYKGKFVGTIGQIGIFSFNVYKTLTCGDGGIMITAAEDLYRRAFAFHDQGHSPLRTGVEIGNRPMIGLDFRMTEIQAAIMLAQLRKLDRIISTLQANKRRYKKCLEGVRGLEFREILDPAGEIATVMTLILPSAELARKIAADLGSKVVAEAGWHVYNNMEHVLEQRTVSPEQCPFQCPIYKDKGGAVEYHKGMLPRTDDLVNRSINISIGVSDPGLSSHFGTIVTDPPELIEARAMQLREVLERHLG